MTFCERLTQALSSQPPRLENENDYLASAVLVPLVNYKGQLRVLFEVRSTKLTWQPGEICFPGGRIEATDSSPLFAAIRETSEEISVPETLIRPLGALDYLVSPIGVILYPFVGYIEQTATVVPSCDEVGRIFSVPLDFLLSAEPVAGRMEVATRPVGDFPFHLMPTGYTHDWRKRAEYEVLFYQYKDYIIWGLTARVLHKFLQICKTVV